MCRQKTGESTSYLGPLCHRDCGKTPNFVAQIPKNFGDSVSRRYEVIPAVTLSFYAC